MTQEKLAGVVEGFYGRTWDQNQRLALFQQMQDWGLNTYFYSPKDDLKHRAIWRQEYTSAELAVLRELVDACDRHGLTFIYGLSPGLDIRFSDPQETAAVQRRFQQMLEIGVQHFALLFDDLPGNMTEEDVQAFGSVAEAQCSVTNTVAAWLREQIPDSLMLFCPTPYCDRMDRWNLGGDDYLDQIGQYLHAGIDCLWTGPEIISHDIDAASIRRLAERIGRFPVIWDNLHANDYDQKRVFCGPYSGRSAEALKLVRGVLTNPNNEFGVNFVPLKTMAACLQDPDSYDPDAAYEAAVADWLPHFESVRGELTVDDLRFLADCYYLPAEDGIRAEELQEVITRLMSLPVDQWGSDFDTFQKFHQQVFRVFDALTELRDRELFYAWSRRVWDLREEMGLLHSYLQKKQAGEDESDGYALEHHLPFTSRGSLTSRLQDHTVMDADGRFHSVHLDQQP